MSGASAVMSGKGTTEDASSNRPYSPEKAPVVKYIAEFIGTYFLVLTIGLNVNSQSIGAPISIGVMLMVMIFALGSVSGGHFNPAVTFAVFLRGGHILNTDVFWYILVQLFGGLMGALTYVQITGSAFVFAPVWEYSVGAALSVEFLYSFLLCYVVLQVATAKDDAKNHYFGLAIGFTVVAAAVAIGSVSGCSLNPAVSFGVLVASAMKYGFASIHFWSLYMLTPFLGAALAALAFLLTRPKDLKSTYGIGSKNDSDDSAGQRYHSIKLHDDHHIVARQQAQSPHAPAAEVLESDSKVPLTRDLASKQMSVGFGFSVHAGGTSEVDGMCFSYKVDKKQIVQKDGDPVYFANKGDNKKVFHWAPGCMTGETGHDDHDKFRFSLDDVARDEKGKDDGAQRFLFFAITCFNAEPHGLRDVNKCNVTCSARCTESEMKLYNCQEKQMYAFSRQFDARVQGKAYVASMMYRDSQGNWSFEILDRPIEIKSKDPLTSAMIQQLSEILMQFGTQRLREDKQNQEIRRR